eukprot:TRINITY_DN7419_c0_g1_i1.p1 TRINITY_DN7419_c0_g1~~TRINITY_DN7419_c0_g1_i1.p1  ORF type:complete len:247 (-),score=62.19 TRINITY_DN7419_c0_g1_i1:93-833(-)
MPWTKSNNPSQNTVSQKSALSEYGLTLEEITRANIPGSRRVCHGNIYFVYPKNQIVQLYNKKLSENIPFQIKEKKKALETIRIRVTDLERQLDKARQEERDMIQSIVDLGGSLDGDEKPKRGTKRQVEEIDESDGDDSTESNDNKKSKSTTTSGSTKTVTESPGEEEPSETTTSSDTAEPSSSPSLTTPDSPRTTTTTTTTTTAAETTTDTLTRTKNQPDDSDNPMKTTTTTTTDVTPMNEQNSQR